MKSVWKFPLKGLDEQAIVLPKGSKILGAKSQMNLPVIYALVDPNEKEKETISIRVYGTGHPISESMTSWLYIDTVMTHNDNLVWHIFYK